MREDAYAKGRRLLVEGRVRLVSVNGGRVEARVRGDSAAAYRVRHVPGAGWACTCPATSRRCSHVLAVQLVTVVDRPEP